MDATLNELEEHTAKLRRQNVERVQRCRARRRAGGLIFKIEIGGNDIDALIAVGALAEAERGNADAVKRAVIQLSSEAYQARKANAASAHPAATDRMSPPANQWALASLER